MENTETPIVLWRLGLSLLAALSTVALSFYFKLDIESKLLLALSRSILQLLLLGYVLLNFIFSVNSLLVVAVYLLTMMMIAATEVVNRQVRTYTGHFWDALISCFIGGGFTAVYATVIVFNPNPWWNPKVFIPTAGMIIGNSVTGPSVAVDRLLSEVSEKKQEVEIRLALGAVTHEALLPALRPAVLAALMPNLNMLSIVGVVSIPGMMTGQLLGGSTPLIAAEYQMAILFLITATTSLATYVTIILAVRNAVMSPEHMLTPSRIMKKEGPKLSVDVAIAKGLLKWCDYIASCFEKRCCFFAYCDPMFSSEHRTDDFRYTSLPTSSIEMNSITNESNYRDTESIQSIPLLQSYRARYRAQDTESCESLTPSIMLILTELNIRSGDLMLFDEKGFSFSLLQGQRVTIEGSSGLGKTRLLRAIAQLDEVESGNITLNMETNSTPNLQNTTNSITLPIKYQQQRQITPFQGYFSYALWRNRVMYIPQAFSPIVGTPFQLLTEVLNYKSSLARCGHAHSVQELPKFCEKMETNLLLNAGKMNQQWSELSGGERHRAIIACGIILTLILQPSEQTSNASAASDSFYNSCVLLLDEPTAACDEVACAAVERVLVESGVACFIVTHDSKQAERLAHTRIFLS